MEPSPTHLAQSPIFTTFTTFTWRQPQNGMYVDTTIPNHVGGSHQEDKNHRRDIRTAGLLRIAWRTETEGGLFIEEMVVFLYKSESRRKKLTTTIGIGARIH